MEPDKKDSAEVSGNIFFQSKRGFKSHLQIKTTVAEGEPMNIVRLLNELEDSVVENGGKPEEQKSFGKPAPSPMEKAATETFGAQEEKSKSDGQCPNGCGVRPWVPAGVSKNTKRPYTAFWGECRTCGFKGR